MIQNGFGPHHKVGIAVCSPHRMRRAPDGKWYLDIITLEWHRARQQLDFPTNINTCELFADGMEVGDARTNVAYRIVKMNPRPEALFFLDDDVLANFDALTKLYFRMQCFPDHDIFAGVYCLKGHEPPEPLIYAGDGLGPYWDWAVGDLLTTRQNGISSVHMGLTLLRTSLFLKMLDAGVVNDQVPFFQTHQSQGRVNGVSMTRRGSEDIHFCMLARDPKVDAQIMVDTSVLAGHQDKATGQIYGLVDWVPPVQRARWLSARDRKEADEGIPCGCTDPACCQNCQGTGKVPFKLALDLGSGGRKRQWPGHKTYSTDIRANCGADYVQDTRQLNLPDNHFDLVASSHHLEHIGRWDQEAVWAEIYRICKPGGFIEHIVPSLEWAAHKIVDGQTDEHTLNVLYGAQEAHGYERIYNLHYFGYTKALAIALAEEAGFVDVQVKDWKVEESLGYNLIITGRKPRADEVLPSLPEPAGEVKMTEDTPVAAAVDTLVPQGS